MCRTMCDFRTQGWRRRAFPVPSVGMEPPGARALSAGSRPQASQGTRCRCADRSWSSLCPGSPTPLPSVPLGKRRHTNADKSDLRTDSQSRSVPQFPRVSELNTLSRGSRGISANIRMSHETHFLPRLPEEWAVPTQVIRKPHKPWKTMK